VNALLPVSRSSSRAPAPTPPKNAGAAPGTGLDPASGGAKRSPHLPGLFAQGTTTLWITHQPGRGQRSSWSPRPQPAAQAVCAVLEESPAGAGRAVEHARQGQPQASPFRAGHVSGKPRTGGFKHEQVGFGPYQSATFAGFAGNTSRRGCSSAPPASRSAQGGPPLVDTVIRAGRRAPGSPKRQLGWLPRSAQRRPPTRPVEALLNGFGSHRQQHRPGGSSQSAGPGRGSKARHGQAKPHWAGRPSWRPAPAASARWRSPRSEPGARAALG